jgi:hypothetical protein
MQLTSLHQPATNQTSFLLHAPLEVLARLRLRRVIEDEDGTAADARLTAILAQYTQERGAPPPEREAPPRPLEALAQAFERGDAEGADAAWVALLQRIPLGAALGSLAPRVVDLLGAAAHAPILFAEFRHHDDRGVGLLARTAVRQLAATTDQRLTWHHRPGLTTRAGSLFDRLAQPPRVTSPSTSIAPTMLATEEAGLPSALIGDVSTLSPHRVEAELSRIAAWSMLQDDPAHAPYGWTHCLTLPQGVLRACAAIPGACAVAATYVLGFRATLGAVKLTATAPPPVTPGQREALARVGVTHEDAHVAKYTLACFDAADLDQAWEGLYLAAAAHLQAWWQRRASR